MVTELSPKPLPKELLQGGKETTWFLVKSLSLGSGGKKGKNLRALQWPPGWRPPEPQPNSHPPVLSFLPGGPDFGGGQPDRAGRPGRRPGPLPAGRRRRRCFFLPASTSHFRQPSQSHAARRAFFKSRPVESPQDRGGRPHASLIQSPTVLSARTPRPRA